MFLKKRKIFFVFVFFSVVNFCLLLRSVKKTERSGQPLLVELERFDVEYSLCQILCHHPVLISLEKLPKEGVEIKFFSGQDFGHDYRFIILRGSVLSPVCQPDFFIMSQQANVFECGYYEIYDGDTFLFGKKPRFLSSTDSSIVFQIYFRKPNFQQSFLKAVQEKSGFEGGVLVIS